MNQINGYNISDPIGGNVGGGGDPIGLGITQGTPDAAAPIGGGGVMPAPAPAQVSADMGMQSVGIPDMSVLPPPTLSQKLIQAGMGMIEADRHGVGLGGAMGAGMNAFNQTQLDYNDLMMKRRHQQLQDYQLMGQIADRHNTELAMQRKLQAGVQFKNAYPELAAMYDADPSEATKMVAEYYKTNGKSPLTGEADNSLLSGDEYLKTLDPKRANQIKAIATGKYPLNKRAATYNKDMQDVLQFDPNATEINLEARKSTRKAFTSGIESRTANSLNTVIGHIGSLHDKIDTLHNGKWQPANYVKNKYKEASGDADITNFETNAKAVADEVVKVWRATGGSVADIEEAQKNLSSSKSPAQLKGALATLVDLLGSKLGSLNEQYKNGMGLLSNDRGILTDESLKTLDKFGLASQMGVTTEAPTEKDTTPAAVENSGRTAAPKNKEEYDALPSGALYTDPHTGTTKRKK